MTPQSQPTQTLTASAGAWLSEDALDNLVRAFIVSHSLQHNDRPQTQSPTDSTTFDFQCVVGSARRLTRAHSIGVHRAHIPGSRRA